MTSSSTSGSTTLRVRAFLTNSGVSESTVLSLPPSPPPPEGLAVVLFVGVCLGVFFNWLAQGAAYLSGSSLSWVVFFSRSANDLSPRFLWAFFRISFISKPTAPPPPPPPDRLGDFVLGPLFFPLDLFGAIFPLPVSCVFAERVGKGGIFGAGAKGGGAEGGGAVVGGGGGG